MSHTSSTQLPPSTADPDPDVDIDLDTVVYAFLDVFPEPTDDQVHQLAGVLGLDIEDFEEYIFGLFGDAVTDLDVNDLEGELTDSQIEPLDVFLVSYFLLNPEPTEDQVHTLASLVNVLPDELEERIYSLLENLTSDLDSGTLEESDAPPGPDTGTEIEDGSEDLESDDDEPYDTDLDEDEMDSATNTNSFTAF